MAFTLSLFTLSIPWALACVGRRVDNQASPSSVVAIWCDEHRTHMLLCCAFSVLLLPLFLLSLLGTHMLTGVLLAPLILVEWAAAVEMFGACYRITDPFGWFASEAWGEPLPAEGWISARLAASSATWPRGVRLTVAGVWTWALAATMVGCAVSIVILYLLFLLLGAILAAVLSGDETVVSEQRYRLPRTVRAGTGGIFASVIATIEGNQIKRGMGGPLADTLFTIEGNEVKRGLGGPLAETLFTIEGDEVKRGMGGPLADTLFTIEGNEVKRGMGGPLAETVVVIDGRQIEASTDEILAETLYTAR